MDKRDGSYYESLSREGINDRHMESQTVRVACMADGLDSNWEDIHEDGIGGTIVKVPDNCGEEIYIVLWY
jgi:hypothetical protein